MFRQAAIFASLLTLAAAATQKKPVTVGDIAPPSAGVSGAIVWAPAGDRFAILDRGMLSVYQIKTGKQEDVIPLARLESAAEKPAREAAGATEANEASDWTNRRVRQSAVQWFADNRHLLVLAAGDLFIVDSEKGTFETLVHTSDNEQDPKLSPDNRYVSFRRGPDLYTVSVKSKAIARLSTGGSETLLNGEPDWVYPEELDLSTGHWWSPDSQSIAYLQFDVAAEPLFPQLSLLNIRGVVEPQRYPNPGDPNASVRLGVVSISGGVTKWMDLGSASANLLARVVWSPDSRHIIAERLNRAQNKLDLLLADTATGAAKTVLHEEDKYWLNVRGQPIFLRAGDQFLWLSERTGFRHLYIFGADGSERAQLTSGDWEVDNIAGVDETRQRIYYTSTEASPMERQLYAVQFDGSGKRRLTTAQGTHTASFSPGGAYYMDDYSSTAAPTRSVICNADDGREIAVYRDADRAPDRYDLQPVETVAVKTADGSTLYAHLIKPANFVATKKYPAVVTIYGGPDEQEVRDAWAGISLAQVLAQNGFVVWQLDNRGSSGRGHAFESAIWHRLGERELSDQQEGIRYLLSLGFVDPRRIGMTGWSYGGYMTLYTVTHAPGLLAAAVAGAPVTDWRNYDSIYTERYMGLPAANPAGYKSSSVLESAAAMEGTKLLILHNLEDDNVHFQNTMQMAAALENAGRNFFMLIYPDKTHGVTGEPELQMRDETLKFFKDNLK